MEGFAAFTGDAADGVGEASQACLRDFKVAGLLEGGDLHAEVTTGGVGNLTEIHEIGTLEAIEGHHDFQPQFVVQQRVDNGKLKRHNS